MGIVFGEVTASVEPDSRGPAEPRPAEQVAEPGDEERADALRLALALMAEREARRCAD